MWDEKCKICNKEMEQIYEDCRRSCRGCEVVYWCPNCGTAVQFYDSHNPGDDEWHIPETVKLLISGGCNTNRMGEQVPPQ